MPFSRQADCIQGYMCILGCQDICVSNFPVCLDVALIFRTCQLHTAWEFQRPAAWHGQIHWQGRKTPRKIPNRKIIDTGILWKGDTESDYITDPPHANCFILWYQKQLLVLKCELDWVTQLDHFNIFIFFPAIWLLGSALHAHGEIHGPGSYWMMTCTWPPHLRLPCSRKERPAGLHD